MSEATETESSHDADAYLKRGYLGEIAGELIFLGLADRYPEHRDKLELLARVEATTATELRAVLATAPTHDEMDQARQRGNDSAAQFAAANWTDMLKSIQPYINDAVERMRAAEAEAPASMASIYQRFTAHEQALADFITLELRGEESSAPAREYLGE